MTPEPITNRSARIALGIITAISLSFGLSALAYPQTHASNPATAQKGAPMATHASGTFDVKLIPQPPDDKAEPSPIGRMSIDKQLHGDLEATSKGQMLAFSTDVNGSAGYVAMERVTGALHGRSGSFVLQHSATMNRGAPQLSITVVPDSGTGELVGLTGNFDIKIVDGKHFYEFQYTLPEAPR